MLPAFIWFLTGDADTRDSKPCGSLRQVNLTYMPN